MHDHNFFSRHFPAPQFIDMPSVGIDISPSAIRMMEIIDHPRMKVGKHAEAFLTTPFLVTEGDQAEVKTILKKWKKEFGLEYVKASLPEEKAYLFDTEVEFGSEEKMRGSIEFSLEENVPLSGSEVIFDYRLVGEGNKPGMVKVAVTVLPRTVVDAYLALFHECGLTPISFLIEAQALSRALIKRGDNGTYLIVGINQSRTGVFIVSKGAVQFTSTLPIGSLDFTKALMKQFSISEEEAERLKETKGFTRTEDNEILAALISTASVFRQEIEKVYIYWNKHRVDKDPSEAIQKVIISGKEALTLGFKEYLTQTLKVSIEVGDVWSNLVVPEEYVPPISLSSALNFGAAIGLAMPEKE